LTVQDIAIDGVRLALSCRSEIASMLASDGRQLSAPLTAIRDEG